MVRTTPRHEGGTPAASPRTLLDIYRGTVASSPDRLAIDCDDGQLTRIELFDAARALAGRLQRRGIGAGDRVGIQIAPGTVDLYVAILGVLLAGAAYVPVDPGATAAETDAVWEAADVTAVVEPELAVREVRPPVGDRRPVCADDAAWVTVATADPEVRVVTHGRALAQVDAGGLDADGAAVEMWRAWRDGEVLVPAPPVQSITPE